MKKIVFLLITLIFCSCKKNNEDIVDNPVPDYSQWLAIANNENDSSYYSRDGFYLANKHHVNSSGGSISSGVSSSFPISGDCEIKIKFSNFTPTMTTPLSDFFLTTFRDKDLNKTLFYLDLSNGYLAFQDTLHNSTPLNSYGKEGEVYLKRVGKTYKGWFRAASDTAFYNNLNYPNGDLIVTLGVLATNNTDPVKRANVHIDAVLVYDGNGNLISDPLSVNSIKYY